MSVSTFNLNAPPRPIPSSQARADSPWFALALPALMAVLLALVVVIGSAAKIMFLLALVPLLLWAAFQDTEKALYVYLAWCWMDGTIRGLFDASLVATVARDLILLTILLGWGARRLLTRDRDPLRAPPGTLLVVLFVINCLLQVANPNSLGLLSDIAGFKIHLAFLPLLFIGYDVFRRGAQVRNLFLFLTLATMVIGVVSVVQYQHGPAWTYGHFPGSQAIISQNISITDQESDNQVGGFKPPGTTTFGGGTGEFIGLVAPLTFTLLLLSRDRLSTPARVGMIAILFAFIVMIFLNGVRSALVEAIVGVTLCGLAVGGRSALRVLLVGAVCAALGLGAWSYSLSLSNGHTGDRFATTFADPNRALHDDRQTFFDQFSYLISHAPLGIGLGRTGAAGGQFATDSADLKGAIFSEAYLGNMIAETGITGGVLIFAIALLFLWRGRVATVSQRDPDDRLLAAGLLAVLGVIVANFFVSPILLGLPGAPLFWVFSAALLRVYRPTQVVQTNTRGTAAL